MAPIKFEEHIKDTLEKRTMSPSPELWSKLSDRLDSEEKKTQKPVYWWLGIAASVAILIMLSIGYFGKTSKRAAEDVLVEEEAPKQQKIKKAVNPVEPIKTEALAQDNLEDPKIDKEVVAPAKKEKTKRRNHLQKEISTTPVKPKEALVQADELQQNLSIEKEKQGFDQAEVDKAVAEVLKFKEDKTKVTDQQIDSLLKSAQRELFKDRIFKNSTNIVDADALLQDVEDDLGLSFRTRVYEALKDGYKKAKTAVANRNN